MMILWTEYNASINRNSEITAQAKSDLYMMNIYADCVKLIWMTFIIYEYGLAGCSLIASY